MKPTINQNPSGNNCLYFENVERTTLRADNIWRAIAHLRKKNPIFTRGLVGRYAMYWSYSPKRKKLMYYLINQQTDEFYNAVAFNTLYELVQYANSQPGFYQEDDCYEWMHTLGDGEYRYYGVYDTNE